MIDDIDSSKLVAWINTVTAGDVSKIETELKGVPIKIYRAGRVVRVDISPMSEAKQWTFKA